MPRRIIIHETQRSQDVRAELREQGYRTYWEVEEQNRYNQSSTRISYWNNGAGKNLLLVEHAMRNHQRKRVEWNSWDIYRQLTGDNAIAATLEALAEYTKTA